MTSTASAQPPASKPNRRGGRRPGAGGKPGNLNALKHGRRSAQFAHLGLILATITSPSATTSSSATRSRSPS